MSITGNAAGTLPRRIAIAGASGLLGRALSAALRTSGCSVVPLVRGDRAAPEAVVWNPAAGEIDPARLEGVDAIVNFAGENVGAGRWSAARKHAIRQSRIDTTRTLVRAIAKMARKPAVLVNASATGFYGARGDEVLSETSGAGAGFLAEVCQAWEAEAFAAEPSGVRVVVARFGVVLAHEGGALAKMLPLFRCAVGGRIGDGRQWMSWITLHDAVRAMVHVLRETTSRGAYNFTAPEPVTNARFTAALSTALRRPAMVTVPAWVLRIALGEMAEATLLASARAVPRRLLAEQFRFDDAEIESGLRRVRRD